MKRYRPYQDPHGWTHGMQEATDGRYVEHSDFDKLADALRDIASYVGEDSQLDINAKNMRETAREALFTVCGWTKS